MRGWGFTYKGKEQETVKRGQETSFSTSIGRLCGVDRVKVRDMGRGLTFTLMVVVLFLQSRTFLKRIMIDNSLHLFSRKAILVLNYVRLFVDLVYAAFVLS